MKRGIAVAQIESFDYDAETKSLAVRFMRVGHYSYEGVPNGIGQELMTLAPAEAVFAFDRKIAGKFKSTRTGS